METSLKKSPYTGPVEPGIWPLCEALNSIPEITTHYSCEGHPRAAMAPYVSFSATEDKARQFAMLIARCVQFGHLKYCWHVTGSFNDEGEWLYSLQSNDTRLDRTFLSTFFPAWRRKVMDTELLLLAKLVTYNMR